MPFCALNRHVSDIEIMPRKSHDLTARKKFHDAIKAGKTVQELDFSTLVSFEDVVRFCSRYRVAKSFKGVILEDFNHKTVEGYNALFKLFLAWSAFEQFLKLMGLPQNHTEIKQLFDEYDATTLCNKIKQYDKKDNFYLFLLSQVNGSHRVEIEKLLKGKALNSSYLASAIRHIFAHGQLTPHANKSRPRNVMRICDAISEFLLQIMDAEFTKRIDKI